jgi:uncharacterized membrane protein YhaH (DUF805 family)
MQRQRGLALSIAETVEDGLGVRQVLLSAKGRLPRLDMLFATACVLLIVKAIGLLWRGYAPLLPSPSGMPPLAWLEAPLAGLALVGLVPCFFILAKRCHDLDRPAWFLLFLLVPAVQLWPLFELIFRQGSPQANRFGAVPFGMVAQWKVANQDL